MHYQDLVDVYVRLEKTSKRLEKTLILCEVIAKTATKDLPRMILLLQGRLFPQWDERKIGVASRLVIKAIALSAGMPEQRIEDSWAKTGDLGIVAKEMIAKKRQVTLFSNDLLVDKVHANLQKLCEHEGSGTVDRKVQLISELLTSARPLEAQYIVRTLLEDLRIGVGEGSVRDSIVWAFFGKELGIEYDAAKNALVLPDGERTDYARVVNSVQEAYDILADFGEVARMIKEKGLEGLSKLTLEPGRPVKVMLFQKAKGMKDALERVGKPAAFEYKYDGFRLELHKADGKITLFTRRLENVTAQFPDVVKVVKEHVKGDSFILDAEAVGFDRKTGKYMPFQSVSQRIRRKYDIKKTAEEFPVEVNVFDILYLDGKTMIDRPFRERREAIAKIVHGEKKKIVIATEIVTEKQSEAEEFYKESLAAGNEGVMAKNLDAIYKPGSRVGFGVKIKPVMETLDLVIVAAEWGEGKRAKWLTSYTLACRDKDGGLMEIGRVSTGVKELESEGTSYLELTKLIEPIIIGQKAKSVRVKPEIVIEVAYEEIQRSPTYSSGFALRFPRFIRLRDERNVSDIDTLETVEELFRGQRHRE
jgi:DNA ligase 1